MNQQEFRDKVLPYALSEGLEPRLLTDGTAVLYDRLTGAIVNLGTNASHAASQAGVSTIRGKGWGNGH